MNEILLALLAKNKDLESMKQYISDETALNIIQAKQDTLDDCYEMVQSVWNANMLAIGCPVEERSLSN